MYAFDAVLVGLVALLVVWRLRSPWAGAFQILVALACAAKEILGAWSLDPWYYISELGEIVLVLQILLLGVYKLADWRLRPAPALAASPWLRRLAALGVVLVLVAARAAEWELYRPSCSIEVTGDAVPRPGTVRVPGGEIRGVNVLASSPTGGRGSRSSPTARGRTSGPRAWRSRRGTASSRR